MYSAHRLRSVVVYDVASVSNQAFLVLDAFIISHNAAGETFEAGGVSASTEKGK